MTIKYSIQLTNRQIEEVAKFSFDLAKLSLGSWVLGLFTSKVELPQIILAFTGLSFAVLFFIIGLRLFKEVE